MGFKEIFPTFFGMAKLEPKAYQEATKQGFGTAALNLLLVALATALGAFFLTWDPLGLVGALVIGFVTMLVVYFIATFIFWIVAKLFGGKGGYMPHYTGLSFIGLWGILNIIPLFGSVLAALGALYGIVMNVFLVKELHKLSTGKAIAAVLIPYVVAFVLVTVLVMIVGAAIFAALAGTGMMTGMPLA